MDAAIIAALITAALAIVLALVAAYRAIRDNIDSTKDHLAGKFDSKCDAINESITKQAQQIGELNGKVSAYNGIRSQCMARFETIEHNITVLHTSRSRKRKRET